MNKKHTLKELADMFAFERRKALVNGQSIEEARMLALKRVLDAAGCKLPVDPEREAFDAWYQVAQIPQGETQAFAAWKAGREELLKTQALAKESDTTEPAWIPWFGYDKSPIPGKQARYEVEYRDGAKTICTHNTLRWSHNGTAGDIIAYRIIY